MFPYLYDAEELKGANARTTHIEAAHVNTGASVRRGENSTSFKVATMSITSNTQLEFIKFKLLTLY
jgi:hypothetical protein